MNMKKLSGHWLVLAAAVAVLAWTGCRKQEQPSGNAAVESAPVLAPDTRPAAVESVPVLAPDTRPVAVDKKLPKLVDLGAKKCIPCKMMAPILEALTSEYAGRMEVEFIDVWENAAAGEKYGIRSIPTQIFYSPEGKELFRHEGFLSKADILAKWSEFGYAFSDQGGKP